MYILAIFVWSLGFIRVWRVFLPGSNVIMFLSVGEFCGRVFVEGYCQLGLIG